MAIVAGMPHGGDCGTVAHRRRSVLPAPTALAGLGTVLCLYRPERGGELAGWGRAEAAESRVRMDSEGVIESLRFRDAAGDCCWRLYLLPESDFLAWDRLQSRLPAADESEPRQCIADRLWRRLAGNLRGDAWHVCPLRLHAVAQAGRACLAASAAPLSAPGAELARRIARIENACLDPSASNGLMDMRF